MTEEYGSASYYVPFLVGFSVFYAVMSISSSYSNRLKQDSNKPLVSIDEATQKVYDSLKNKFFAGYLTSRAIMWAKAPYMYLIYSQIHGFTFEEIGILFLIDNGMSLLSGLFVGYLSDKHGRKIVSSLYPLQMAVNLSLRLVGMRSLAYTAQVITGVGEGILATTQEAWITSEFTKKLNCPPKTHSHLVKKLFTEVAFYDSIVSLGVTLICATLFSLGGLYLPIFFAIALSLCSFGLILFLWDENYSEKSTSMLTDLSESFSEFKSLPILALGIIDALYKSCLKLFVFVWTPVLQNSIHGSPIHPGMIYVLMIVNWLAQNKCLKMANSWNLNIYYMNAVYFLFFISNFAIIYFVDDFSVRLLCLCFINVSL